MKPTDYPTHSYVARQKCGCVVTVIGDMGDKWTADEVRNCIIKGMTIDRVARGTPEFTQALEHIGCTCEKEQQSLF
jgi:hypothetical protein